MHVEVEGENGFFPPIASNSCILHAIVKRTKEQTLQICNMGTVMYSLRPKLLAMS